MERFFLTRSTHFHIPGQFDPIVLLSGPPSSGKTSLLFQFALNSAVENNGAVVILCHRRRLETNPPFLSQGVDPSNFEIFRRVQMKYVDDDEGIKKFFAAFHMFDTFPVSVIIDDFADFFMEGIAKKDTTALEEENWRWSESCRFVEMQLIMPSEQIKLFLHSCKRGPCELLLSDSHKGDTPRLLYIYKKWVSCIYTVKGDGSGSFILEKLYSDTANAKKKSAKYSIALQYLVLEGLVEGDER